MYRGNHRPVIPGSRRIVGAYGVTPPTEDERDQLRKILSGEGDWQLPDPDDSVVGDEL